MTSFQQSSFPTSGRVSGGVWGSGCLSSELLMLSSSQQLLNTQSLQTEIHFLGIGKPGSGPRTSVYKGLQLVYTNTVTSFISLLMSHVVSEAYLVHPT